jgi:hypothetical protein
MHLLSLLLLPPMLLLYSIATAYQLIVNPGCLHVAHHESMRAATQQLAGVIYIPVCSSRQALVDGVGWLQPSCTAPQKGTEDRKLACTLLQHAVTGTRWHTCNSFIVAI